MTLRQLLGAGCALLALSTAPVCAKQTDFSALAKSTSGLIGYWAFEGNYNDESGKGNNAQPNGDPTLIKFAPGVNGGQSVELDNETADTQYLSVAAPVGGTFDTPNQTDLFWGAWRGQPGYSITGDIDDTVIYNRALTADEVKALYDAMMK